MILYWVASAGKIKAGVAVRAELDLGWIKLQIQICLNRRKVVTNSAPPWTMGAKIKGRNLDQWITKNLSRFFIENLGTANIRWIHSDSILDSVTWVRKLEIESPCIIGLAPQVAIRWRLTISPCGKYLWCGPAKVRVRSSLWEGSLSTRGLQLGTLPRIMDRYIFEKLFLSKILLASSAD